MKRYLVTEELMRSREQAAIEQYLATQPGTKLSFMTASMNMDEIRQESRAIEVPDWATHFFADGESFNSEHDMYQELPK